MDLIAILYNAIVVFYSMYSDNTGTKSDRT